MITGTEGIPIHTVESERLVTYLDDIWNSASQQRLALENIRDQMRENALIPAHRVLELLDTECGKEHS